MWIRFQIRRWAIKVKIEITAKYDEKEVKNSKTEKQGWFE